jgi:hypothetical protein
VIYQLVLITNLGVVTPLVNFPTWNDCMMEKGRIAKTQQYSAECLPAQSPQQLQQNIESSMKMMLDTINKLSQGQTK